MMTIMVLLGVDWWWGGSQIHTSLVTQKVNNPLATIQAELLNPN